MQRYCPYNCFVGPNRNFYVHLSNGNGTCLLFDFRTRFQEGIVYESRRLPVLICNQKKMCILLYQLNLFLGTFLKLRKVAISFFRSVRLEQLGFHWTDFLEILYLRIFRKSIEKNSSCIKT
jgi:hypothetical protein